MKGKIVTIVGARPQFVKAAAVSRALSRLGGISEVLVHTGQHYDDNMSAIFFNELGIPQPDYHLEAGSGTHGRQTGAMLERIEQVLLRESPQCVMVYGDTNSTLAGALAAVKLGIPVAHVEAGLRSFNRAMPEEINRVVTDHVANVLYVPTSTGMSNLAHEGLASRALLVGDVMYDVALFYGAQVSSRKENQENSRVKGGDLLVTIHRAENTDHLPRLTAIVEALVALADSHRVTFPIHPRTARILDEAGLLALVQSKLTVLPPCGYQDMVALQKSARLIITDSGGVQKEALFFGIPCVTLRDETEWVETLEGGWNVLVPPTSSDAVKNAIDSALCSAPDLTARTSAFGDGRASEHIASDLAVRFLGSAR